MVPCFLHVVSHHGLEDVASDAQDLLVNHEALLETVTYVHNSMFKEQFKWLQVTLDPDERKEFEVIKENCYRIYFLKEKLTWDNVLIFP